MLYNLDMAGNTVFWGDSIAQGGFNVFGGVDHAEEGKTLSAVTSAHPASSIPSNSNVIVSVGTNDAASIATSSNSENQAKQIARQIIDTAAEMQAAGNNVVVVGMRTPLDSFRFQNGTQAQTDQFQNIVSVMNTEMRSYAAQRGISFQATNIAANLDGGDGLHLSAAGYRKMYTPALNTLNSGTSAPAPTGSSPESDAPAEVAETTEFTSSNVQEILSRPITMDTVRELQRGLGVEVDGRFGPETLSALRELVGDEQLEGVSAQNWALIGRGARDAEGVEWVTNQIGEDQALRQAVAGNIESRIGATAGSLAANQYQSSLSVLGYLDAEKIGVIDEATYEALENAHNDFESIVPEFQRPDAGEATADDEEAEVDADAEVPEAGAEVSDEELRSGTPTSYGRDSDGQASDEATSAASFAGSAGPDVTPTPTPDAAPAAPSAVPREVVHAL